MSSDRNTSTSVGLLALGALLIVVGSVFAAKTAMFLSGAQSVTAIVASESARGPIFSFNGLDGQPKNLQADVADFPNLRTGSYALIDYNPSNPSDVRPADFSSRWLFSIIFAVPGFVLLLIGFVMRALQPQGDVPQMTSAASTMATPQPPRPEPRVERPGTAEPKQAAGSTANGSPGSQRPTSQAPTKSTNAGKARTGGPDMFGVLKPLLRDESVTDIIIANYQHISVRKHGQTERTQYRFPDEKTYENFVDRILLEAGVTYSTAKPIVDGMLSNGIRIHAVNRVLCEDGPYTTLRLSRYPTVTCDQLQKNGLAPKEIFDYLKAMVKSGNTILLSGEVASGKTTLLRALAAEVQSDNSIVVIEDTPEIKIEHPMVRYLRTREANASGVGTITHADCIRAGLRMAMNRIILGEIRDPEAAESFIDVCVSGHPGLSTIHARNCHDALNRLELLLGRQQRGASADVLKGQIGSAVQCAIFLNICPKTGARRIMEVLECARAAEGGYIAQTVFKYDIINNQPTWGRLAQASFFESSMRNALGRSPLDGVGQAVFLESSGSTAQPSA